MFYTPEDRAKGMPQPALEPRRRWASTKPRRWRVRKDGKRFWASVVLDAIHNERGELFGFAKITRDLTERAR